MRSYVTILAAQLTLLAATNAFAGVNVAVNTDPCPLPEVAVQAAPCPETVVVPQALTALQKVAVAVAPQQVCVHQQAERIGIFKRIKIRRQAAKAAGIQARNTYALKSTITPTPIVASVVPATAVYAAPATMYVTPPLIQPEECHGMNDCD